MRHLVHDEKGFALLTTLMLMVLGFGIVATLLYMITQSTKTTRLGQQYATALDAAKGGADMIINMMENDSCNTDYCPDPGLADATVESGGDCLGAKLDPDENATSWSQFCPGQPTSSDPTIDPDLTLRLADHQVYVKVVHKMPINGGVLYRINMRARRSNSEEHAEISFLYRLPSSPP